MTMQKVIVSSAFIAAFTIQGCAKPKSDPEKNDCSLHNEEDCTSSDYVSVCYWTKSGVCANRKPAGQDCSDDAGCLSGQCNFKKSADTADTESSPDADDSAATGTCSKAENDSCSCDADGKMNSNGSCVSECSDTMMCVAAKGATDSKALTCQPNPAVHPLCDTDAECKYDTKLPTCRRSKADDKDKNCRAPQVNGLYCEFSADCASDNCDENVCTPKGKKPEPITGKACKSSTECTDKDLPICRASKAGDDKTCQAKQKEGGYCSGPGDCESGTCTDSKCAKSDKPVSDECSATKPCSAGKFCINQLGGSMKCEASKNADGSFCKENSDCKTDSTCKNSLCTPPNPLPEHEKCKSAADCKDNKAGKLCLNTSPDTMECQATKHAAAAYCKEGSDCASGSCSSNRCLGAAGDACSATAACASGSFCINQSDKTMLCQASKNAEGKFCVAASDCAKGECKDSVCTSSDPKPTTDACTKATEATVCKTAPNTHCVNVSSTKMQCGALHVLNDFCKADADCASGLACEASKCKIKNEGHCDEDAKCQSNYCHGNTCKDKPADPYAKCSASVPCQTDYECLADGSGNKTCQLKNKKTRGETCNDSRDCQSKRDTCAIAKAGETQKYCVAKCTDGKTEIFDPRCTLPPAGAKTTGPFQCEQNYSCQQVNVVIGGTLVPGQEGRLYDACRLTVQKDSAPKVATIANNQPAAVEPKAAGAAAGTPVTDGADKGNTVATKRA